MAQNDKLRDDPIVEALVEIRFAVPELQEVVVGRLSDIWRQSRKNRLPTGDIPSPVRAANPNLLYLPTVEIRDADGINSVRLGGNTLGLHFTAPYAGWEVIYPKIGTVIDAVFGALPTIVIKRVGLRYVNIFTRARHYVDSVHSFAVMIKVRDTSLSGPISLSFTEPASAEHSCTTRLASRDFLVGQVPPDGVAAVDLDVATPPTYSNTSVDAIKLWIDQAHTFEKQAFRRLLPDDLYEKLRSTTH
jgi:uncharacterized protein (TIGR04255 family)